MIEAKVIVNHDEEIWMDQFGSVLKEGDAMKYNVSHSLIHPEICIVMDEVGGDIS